MTTLHEAVTVAIPVRNAGPLLVEVLDAVDAQRLDREVELLVCDSGSTDGSPELAARHGARVLIISAAEFSHGGTRNLLMEQARGDHVAFLTQDSTPADDRWLQRLLDGFAIASDVALVTGPYLPRPEASLMLRRELSDYFASMHDGAPRVYRLADAGDPPRPGPATFHTDANGAVLKAAWEKVPFRLVAYAEDQQLCLDMLGAGFAKVFHPDAAVVHSHSYSAVEQFRRHFDEFRALREVYGHREAANPRQTLGRVRAEVRRDREFAAANGSSRGLTARSVGYHAARAVAAALGSRADSLPAPVRRAMSLERRSGFRPLHER
jgi:glycosyltransferase involved in cell wall biosynthesis